MVNFTTYHIYNVTFDLGGFPYRYTVIAPTELDAINAALDLHNLAYKTKVSYIDLVGCTATVVRP